LTDSLRFLLKSTPKMTAGFTTRGSFIDGHTANVREITWGVIFQEKLTLGLGYHWLKTKREKNIFQNQQLINTKLKMRYFSLNISYMFYQKRNWYISLPVEIGFGNSFRQDESRQRYTDQTILLYEPVMLAEYRFFKYLGVAGGFGFRLMLKNNLSLEEKFSSPIYVARLKLNFSEIYKDLK